ncbi:MAG: ABC transporter ATP-binding protein, partial [Candidatus Aminicenantes bacterium]|nr:ABC transporter ATP-binding protein [Candidatus Aminicenantes bacterium]
MAPIITARKLTKQYAPPKGPTALKDVDLDIEEGEVFGLLGPNGAGKTTLLAVLSGLFPPTAGDASVAGASVVRSPLAVKRAIGVVPEEIALYGRLSGRRNLRYFGALQGLRGRDLERAVDEALESVGLTGRADERAADYSNGMKRRLNIAAGTLHKPLVLLMDEPTLGLDPESRRHVLDLVGRFRRDEGMTILYATHHLEEAREISDRVGIIHRGRIVALGAPAALIAEFGGDETLRLSLAAAAPPPEAALSALRRVRGVRAAASDADGVTVSLRSAAEVLPDIL